MGIPRPDEILYLKFYVLFMWRQQKYFWPISGQCFFSKHGNVRKLFYTPWKRQKTSKGNIGLEWVKDNFVTSAWVKHRTEDRGFKGVQEGKIDLKWINVNQ